MNDSVVSILLHVMSHAVWIDNCETSLKLTSVHDERSIDSKYYIEKTAHDDVVEYDDF